MNRRIYKLLLFCMVSMFSVVMAVVIKDERVKIYRSF
mgnify:CR=1 FL=1